MTENNYGNSPQPQQAPAHPAPEGVYASYAQIYGQGLPQQMDKPALPQSLRIATWMTGLIVVFNLLNSFLSQLFVDELATEAVNGLSSFLPGADSSEFDMAMDQQMAMQNTATMVIAEVLSQVVTTAAIVTFMVFLVKGYNWARIVLTIYAAFNALGLFGVLAFIFFFHWILLLSLVPVLLSIVVIVFYWLPASNTYMRYMRVYRSWQKQRAYMGA